MEMATELAVFLGVGVLLIGLFTGFVYQWHFEDDVETLQDLYEDGPVTYDTKLDRVAFINAARDYWEFCNHSYANGTKAYYVYDSEKDVDGILNKSIMFDQYKTLGWCKSIQSVNQSCGKREDVNITSITLPRVISLKCENKTLYIT